MKDHEKGLQGDEASVQHPKKPNKQSGIASIIAIVLLLAVGWFFLWKNWQARNDAVVADCQGPVGVKPGDCAPAFSFPLLQAGKEGPKVALSNFMDKPTVLYFFSTSCSVCEENMPLIKELQKQYKDRVNFVYMNSFEMEPSIEAVQSVPNSPILLGDAEVFRAYDAMGMPTMVFLNRAGRVVQHVSGGHPSGWWKRSLEELLASSAS